MTLKKTKAMIAGHKLRDEWVLSKVKLFPFELSVSQDFEILNVCIFSILIVPELDLISISLEN
jgi:hypothetical protein